MPATANSFDMIDAKPNQIGGEVVGLDVRTLTTQSPEIPLIRDFIYRNKLIVIRGQDLTPQDYVDFARKLGRPQVYFQKNYHHPDHDEIFVSSNVIEPDGTRMGVSGTGKYWHTDCAFESKPLSWTSIYPQVFPKTLRGTQYVDMERIYRILPDNLRDFLDKATTIQAGQLRYKVQASDIDCSLLELLERINREVPPVKHPAVITHPATGQRALYMNSGFTVGIEGISHEENQSLLKKVFDFIEAEQNIHHHSWDHGDLIIWDNRLLIHKSTGVPKGELSKSYRIGIYDGLPFYVGLEA